MSNEGWDIVGGFYDAIWPSNFDECADKAFNEGVNHFSFRESNGFCKVLKLERNLEPRFITKDHGQGFILYEKIARSNI